MKSSPPAHHANANPSRHAQKNRGSTSSNNNNNNSHTTTMSPTPHHRPVLSHHQFDSTSSGASLGADSLRHIIHVRQSLTNDNNTSENIINTTNNSHSAKMVAAAERHVSQQQADVTGSTGSHNDNHNNDNDNNNHQQQQHHFCHVHTGRKNALPPSSKRPGAYAATPGAGYERAASIRYQQYFAPSLSDPMARTDTTIPTEALRLVTLPEVTEHTCTEEPTMSNNSGRSHGDQDHDPHGRVVTSGSSRGKRGNVDVHVDVEEPEGAVPNGGGNPNRPRQRLKNRSKNNHETNNNGKRKCIILGGIAIVVIVIVLAIVIPLVVVKSGGGEDGNNNNSEPQNNNSAATAMVNVNLDKTLLPNVDDSTWQTIAVNVESPQHLAYQWLLQDPTLQEYEVWRREQRFALATFYYAFQGPTWKATDPQAQLWLDVQQNECEWMTGYEPKACHANGRVQLINVTRLSGFTGSVPPELSLLTELEGLDFSYNVLTTTVEELLPLWSTKLLPPSLSRLFCVNCRLTGTLPPTLGIALSNLVAFDLNDNGITGTLPLEIGRWSKLEQWSSSNNQLSGTIPPEISRMTRLEILKLSFNDLTQIPTSLGLLTQLQELDLESNLIPTEIPTQIGALTNLVKLNLASWDREGSSSTTIPTELGLLTNLGTLFLEQSALTGTFPTELGLLTSLSRLVMYQNSLRGPIPPAIGNMTGLTILDFGFNQLSSSIPTEMGLLSQLQQLYMQSNQLSGSVPTELGDLPLLEALHIHSNPEIIQDLPLGLCRPGIDLRTDWCSYDACCST